MKLPLSENLIAPCGMNCGVCKAYLAWSRELPNTRHCASCLSGQRKCTSIKRCKSLRTGAIRFCFECADFPCEKLQTLDKRYRTRYQTSPIENLRTIQSQGIAEFLNRETEKWRCTKCGGVVTIHGGKCYDCEVGRGLRQ